ncbi:MAG: hypothetical protein A2Y73_00175 [Chloroflexi bacterium RBG_13_56_8]|nr:MAG: hypothetical protein A2Y73_00175 [Chloroflexi bacterium RBG_13_56_8]
MNSAPAGRGKNLNQRGATLLGELLALAIVGGALFILLTGLSTSSRGVAVEEQHVTAENYARKQIEAIKAVPYQANPTVVPYPTIEVEENYEVEVQVTYWLSPTGPFVPVVQPASGLQNIQVQVFAEGESQPTFILDTYKVDRP